LWLAASCSGGRDPEILGVHRAPYEQALAAGRTEEAIRSFYAAYLDGLRSRDPQKALVFFRPDMPPEARNSMRMGLEFVKILDSMEGRITEIKDLGDRALVRGTENATFRFRNRQQQDRRERVHQLVRLGGHWYFEITDLGRARQKK
jgi:hypothetical protein